MFTTTTMFTLIGALVGAGAYAPEAPVVAAIAPIPLQAVADVRRARVDIYCGHNAQAVAGIRSASATLRVSNATVPAEALAALDQAAWMMRHDEYVRAEQALDAALGHMDALSDAA